ncbi:unnamed protein product [Discosporangium mesarthrocarpum]
MDKLKAAEQAAAAVGKELKSTLERLRETDASLRLALEETAELRGSRDELRGSLECSQSERVRLERELWAARAEAREVDTDVAQVLNALSAAEAGRDQAEAELANLRGEGSSLREELRRAIEHEAMAVAEAQAMATRELSVLQGKATELEGQVTTYREELQSATKQAAESMCALEQERDSLGTKVRELEEVLTRAQEEGTKVLELAQSKEVQHEREAQALRKEVTQLESELQAEVACSREQREFRGALEQQLVGREGALRDKVVELEEVSRKTAASQEQWEREKGALHAHVSQLEVAVAAEAKRAREAEEVTAALSGEGTREKSELKVRLTQLEGTLHAETMRADEITARGAFRLKEAEMHCAALRESLQATQGELEEAKATARSQERRAVEAEARALAVRKEFGDKATQVATTKKESQQKEGASSVERTMGRRVEALPETAAEWRSKSKQEKGAQGEAQAELVKLRRRVTRESRPPAGSTRPVDGGHNQPSGQLEGTGIAAAGVKGLHVTMAGAGSGFAVDMHEAKGGDASGLSVMVANQGERGGAAHPGDVSVRSEAQITSQGHYLTDVGGMVHVESQGGKDTPVDVQGRADHGVAATESEPTVLHFANKVFSSTSNGGGTESPPSIVNGPAPSPDTKASRQHSNGNGRPEHLSRRSSESRDMSSSLSTLTLTDSRVLGRGGAVPKESVGRLVVKGWKAGHRAAFSELDRRMPVGVNRVKQYSVVEAGPGNRPHASSGTL